MTDVRKTFGKWSSIRDPVLEAVAWISKSTAFVAGGRYALKRRMLRAVVEKPRMRSLKLGLTKCVEKDVRLGQ
jgi:hypothetical protein